MSVLPQMLAELYTRRQKLDHVIASLELLEGKQPSQITTSAPGRRGRKSMGRAERTQVSERMKKYWADRRKA